MQLRDLLWAIVDELMLKIDKKKTHTNNSIKETRNSFFSLCMVNESMLRIVIGHIQ